MKALDRIIAALLDAPNGKSIMELVTELSMPRDTVTSMLSRNRELFVSVPFRGSIDSSRPRKKWADLHASMSRRYILRKDLVTERNA